MTLPLLLFHNQGKGRPVGGGGEIIQWLLRDDFTEVSTLYYEGFKARNAEGTAARDGAYTAVDIENAAGPYGGTSAAFDGSTSLVSLNTSSLFSALDTAEGTLLIWVKVSGAGVFTDSTVRYLGVIREAGGDVIAINKTATNNRFQFLRTDDTASSSVLLEGVSDTGWLCFACTWSETADEFKAYYQGSQTGSTQTGLGSFAGTPNNVLLGKWVTATGYWDGNLAHCAVWTTPLSAAQISAIYSGSSATILATEAANLIGYWPLQEVDVNGTAATPGPGTRTVNDDNTVLAITSGVARNSGAGSGNNDPRISYDAISRAAGRLLVAKYNNSSGNANLFTIVLSVINTAPWSSVNDGIFFHNNATICQAGTTTPSYGSYANSTDYYVAVVLKSTGSYYFIKGGIYTNWTLLWIDTDNTGDPLYPAFSMHNDADQKDADNIRVPDETWLPTPLAYTEFTAANGTSLDALPTLTTGPDSQAGVTARSWTEGNGQFDIQSNEANTTGADPGTYIATLDASDADVVIDAVININAGFGLLIARYADNSNLWELRLDSGANTIYIVEDNITTRASTAVTINTSTDYDARLICYGQTIDAFVDGGNKISYGSASAHETETKHGIGSSAATCTFDNFTVFARDSGYSKLDSYTS